MIGLKPFRREIDWGYFQLTTQPDVNQIRSLLAAYGLGDILDITHHSGTAAPTWRVTTSRGTWLLRTRGARTSTDEAIAFDHGLRRHLVANGIPTAAPVPTKEEKTFTRHEDKAYEVYAFLEGKPYGAAPPEAVIHASSTLARFHLVASTYAAARRSASLAQYGTLGFPETSERMEDPLLLEKVYEWVETLRVFRDYEAEAETCRKWIRRLLDAFGREVYDGLPHALTHGDYTPANLIFDDSGQVAGIFDFDWARWAARVRDVADGMYFFSADRRSPLQPSDIWSLTDTADFQVERCVYWLRAYAEISPLTAEEIQSIPLAFAARWLSIRVEGMAKVPAKDRVRFCYRDVRDPLEWLDRHWPEVTKRLL